MTTTVVAMSPASGKTKEARAAVRERLAAFLTECGIDAGDGAATGVSLIQSGRLDSVALLNLALWIQEEVGPNVDLTSFDLATEWDTLDAITRFIEMNRSVA